MSAKDLFREFAKSPVAVGIASLLALLLMAWVVSVRLGDTAMPMPGIGSGTFVLPGDATDMGGGPADEGRLPFLSPSMPPFSGIEAWLNASPQSPESLKGKVVLIDFWTYSCINCIRTLPYVTAWHEAYKDDGFTVIGVHTPEFAFEKDERNVRAAIARHGITYPVALDNAYGTWNNYANRYWPAHYLFDAEGRLRYTHFGEGKYEETEANIRTLLAEAGAEADAPMATADVEAPSPEFSRIGTRETYLGYGRMEFLGSPEPVRRDEPQAYSAVASPERNRFYFEGSWQVEDERSVAVEGGAGITYRYTASVANLVMGADEGTTVRAEVTIDGQPVPEALRGPDVYERDGRTWIDVYGQRLYGIIDARGDYATRTLRIRFDAAGVQVYAFTFG